MVTQRRSEALPVMHCVFDILSICRNMAPIVRQAVVVHDKTHWNGAIFTILGQESFGFRTIFVEINDKRRLILICSCQRYNSEAVRLRTFDIINLVRAHVEHYIDCLV